MRNERLWVSRPEAAELCGLTPRHWSDVVAKRLEPDAIRGKGATLRYWAPAVVAAETARQVEAAKPATPVDDDPLMNGPVTDGLERYRLASAALKEHDLAERQQELVRRDVIANSLSPAVAAFRTGTENIRRRYGNDAGDAVNEMVDDFGDAVTRTIAKLSETK